VVYLSLEAGDQFAVGGDQRLLRLNIGDHGALRGMKGVALLSGQAASSASPSPACYASSLL
jgi:hypothetical protein